MRPRPTQQNGDRLGEAAPLTAVALAERRVRSAFHRGRSRLSMYGGEFRIARAVLDALAGVDPGAVRLAQTLLGLIPTRRAAPRDPTPSHRGAAR